MQEIFSTDGADPRDRFRLWREICEDRLVPMDQAAIGDEPFQASICGTSIGGVTFTKFTLQNVRASTTPRTIRHENNKTDHLFMSMVLSGTVRSSQNDRTATDTSGDFSIRDTNTPWLIEHSGHTEVLAIGIPRERLEGMLGPARYFAGLTVDGHLPATGLARSFLRDLLRVETQLAPPAADRMASVAIDLVAASLAERLARDPPKALHATLIVQQAKAYVAANLGNPDLDPSQVAAAVGISLRYLQQLFRAYGRNVAAWIWQQRLKMAAQRLSDPACINLPLGELAFRCGFASQAHFSRRFRDHYSMSPRDYRHMALVQAAAR